ncbi:AAA family ATPase [Cyclobacterium plantarum]|uniref:AAA family ATPase n=1 Tax=Cyclobacterium plantarum TaxID=2716263 RepID=UPI003F6E45E4
MKFELTGKFLSLQDFKTPELENFCVITGLNGSGKTQFLALINQLQNKIEHTVKNQTQDYKIKLIADDFTPGTIRYITYNGLNPGNLGSMNKQAYENIKNTIIEQLKQNRNQNYPQRNVAEKIAKSLGKPYAELLDTDVFNYSLTHDDLGNADIFQTNLGQLFYNYAYNRERNNYRKYRNSQGASFEVFSDEEFNERFVNPWELINEFLEMSKSDYFVEGVKEEDFDENMNFSPQFINKLSSDKVQVNALSSGERVIVSLAFCLFNIELNENNNFPKILLLDEPDAPLHPSMTREFLDVIYKELVVKQKIKVILTTHSPSTVALTDEKYLYCMTKSQKRFEKVQKDRALSILTAGLNTISVDYENRRQIFVESNYDRKYYEVVYNKSKNLLLPGVSLHFISSGIDKIPVSQEVPDGDCTRVKNIVKELVKGGNKKVYGVIDWDRKNNTTDKVLVNGHNQRYSIENYIFDPIYLSALLLDYQIITREDLGFENNENYTDFKNLSERKLNDIVQFITGKVKNKLPQNDTNSNTRTVEYLNQKGVQVPTWYLEYKGHELEKLIIEAFPKLKSEFGTKTKLPEVPDGLSEDERRRKKKENKIFFENQLVNIIKEQIVNKIIDNIPEFIPLDVINLFKKIQD